MTGEIVGGWSSVIAAYSITAVVLVAQAIRLLRGDRRSPARGQEEGS